MFSREVPDPIIARVMDIIATRSAVGIVKYGTMMNRGDLKPIDWINHAQQEMLDGANYLERLKDEVGEIEKVFNYPIGLKTNFERVQEFVRVFEHDAKPYLWMELILEEVKETFDAWGIELTFQTK